MWFSVLGKPKRDTISEFIEFLTDMSQQERSKFIHLFAKKVEETYGKHQLK
jgi:hypothetical protein